MHLYVPSSVLYSPGALQGFRKGIDVYFTCHDGRAAVTCDDFRQAMADANGKNFRQFEHGYLQ